MVIKSRASELKGYEESKIITLTYTHNRREIVHNLKFHFLIL